MHTNGGSCLCHTKLPQSVRYQASDIDTCSSKVKRYVDVRHMLCDIWMQRKCLADHSACFMATGIRRKCQKLALSKARDEFTSLTIIVDVQWFVNIIHGHAAESFFIVVSYDDISTPPTNCNYNSVQMAELNLFWSFHFYIVDKLKGFGSKRRVNLMFSVLKLIIIDGSRSRETSVTLQGH